MATTPTPRPMKSSQFNKFRLDHPDYAALSPMERRRAIVRLLRKTNFCISSVRVDRSEIDATRSNVPGAAELEKYSMQAHASGVIWVRCNSNERPVRNGEPVCFDMVTGSEVTGTPTYASTETEYGTIERRWHTDAWHVVGYAVTDPEQVDDHYEVAIHMFRPDPTLNYEQCLGFLKSNSPRSPIESGPYYDIDNEMSSSVFRPSRNGEASWIEMDAYAFIIRDGYYKKMLIGFGVRVVNPYHYPMFGQHFILAKQGDVYYAVEPLNKAYNRRCSMYISASGTFGAGSLSGGVPVVMKGTPLSGRGYTTLSSQPEETVYSQDSSKIFRVNSSIPEAYDFAGLTSIFCGCIEFRSHITNSSFTPPEKLDNMFGPEDMTAQDWMVSSTGVDGYSFLESAQVVLTFPAWNGQGETSVFLNKTANSHGNVGVYSKLAPDFPLAVMKLTTELQSRINSVFTELRNFRNSQTGSSLSTTPPWLALPTTVADMKSFSGYDNMMHTKSRLMGSQFIPFSVLIPPGRPFTMKLILPTLAGFEDTSKPLPVYSCYVNGTIIQ